MWEMAELVRVEDRGVITQRLTYCNKQNPRSNDLDASVEDLLKAGWEPCGVSTNPGNRMYPGNTVYIFKRKWKED